MRGDIVITCEYKPYFAIIGDIINSKKIQDRDLIQQKLTMILNKVNETYVQKISSKFMITLGDEFQGLMSSGECVVEIIDIIEREMYPIELRFGIGVGSVSTPIDYNLPIGADGPAYYNARKVIEHHKISKTKKMEIRTNIGVKIDSYSYLSDLINSIFSLNTIVKLRWKQRQREAINAYISCNGNQNSAASLLGVNQSNIQRALKASGYYEYQQANKSIANILSTIKENVDA